VHYQKVDDTYDEIAVLYVFEKYRNQGFGSVLLAQTIEKIHSKGKKFLVISSNPVVLKHIVPYKIRSEKSIFKLPKVFVLHKVKFILHPFSLFQAIRKELTMEKQQFLFCIEE
jgi:GNAT superfamily N-acetyltransferase